MIIRCFRIQNDATDQSSNTAALVPDGDILALDQLQATIIYQDSTHSLVSACLEPDQIQDIADMAESPDPLSLAAVAALGIEAQYMGMDLVEVAGRWLGVSGSALPTDMVQDVVWA